jgi:phosphatidylinositol alpha-1,6-mannosyltransferase
VNKLRLGIIAPEFPPELGGMQIMALHIATHLAKSHHVIVCTTRAPRPEYGEFQIFNNLRARTEADVDALNRVDVDIWLAMNAGYAAIAHKLSKPVLVYFHGNDFLNPWIVSTPFLLKVLSKIPRVGKFWYAKRREYAGEQIRKGITSAAGILTNSSNTRELIRRNYPQCVDIAVCHPGVEDKFFQTASGSSDEKRSPLRLLTVSRLQRGSRRKNVAGVLKALAILKGRLSFTYSIVGDGDDLGDLKKLSSELGLADRVIFHGRVVDRDLLHLYQTANLFVLPVKASSVDVEGFGIVYLEANASGVPVLCSAVGGAVDAVIDGQTGIVLSSSEPDEIAAGIERFCSSRTSYAPDQLRTFASQFTWKIAAERIESQILAAFDAIPGRGALKSVESPGAAESGDRLRPVAESSHR